MPRELEPHEKLMDLSAQIRAAQLGVTTIITCPYCQGVNDFSPNVPDCKLCCVKFMMATEAICEREFSNALIDSFHRIQDTAEGQAVFN